MTINSDVQRPSPGSIVEVFELDATNIGGASYFFHSGLNETNQPIIWQGVTYAPFPVMAEGFEMTSKGTSPTPTLRVANITGIIGALCKDTDDLVGAKVIRRRTFVKYLDPINFTSGLNPNYDPNAYFPDEIWYVNRKVAETKIFVEFELASAMDVEGVMLPGRQVIANSCVWIYKSPECGYTGTNYFDLNDAPTTAGLDRCSRRLNGCSLRHGPYAELPFGGFPASGKV